MDLYLVEKNGRKRKAEKAFCKFCDKEFLRRAVKSKKSLFCSHACSSEQRTKDNTQLIKCYNCKSDFRIANSKLKSSKHGFHFCSRACKDYAQSLDGDCPEIRPDHYGNSDGKEACKNLIKNSENPICAGCGVGKRFLLSVHHMDGDRNNNPIDGSNWEIVCGNCHRIRHLKFNGQEWIYHTSSLTPREELKKITG